jgi:hypothetical protein
VRIARHGSLLRREHSNLRRRCADSNPKARPWAVPRSGARRIGWDAI